MANPTCFILTFGALWTMTKQVFDSSPSGDRNKRTIQPYGRLALSVWLGYPLL
jgi:hypothetical protein